MGVSDGTRRGAAGGRGGGGASRGEGREDDDKNSRPKRSGANRRMDRGASRVRGASRDRGASEAAARAAMFFAGDRDVGSRKRRARRSSSSTRSAPLSSSRGEGGGKRVACERGARTKSMSSSSAALTAKVAARLVALPAEARRRDAPRTVALAESTRGLNVRAAIVWEGEGVAESAAERNRRAGRGTPDGGKSESLWLTARLLISGYGITAHAGVGFEGSRRGRSVRGK